MKKDFIIVGQGIAGSILAFLLRTKGHSVVVFDDGYIGSSSIIAAGMWNPVTFRKVSLGWMASDLLSEANTLYTSIEKETGSHFYHPHMLARIFPDTGSANLWDERSVDPELSLYLTDDQSQNIITNFIQPHGHGVLRGCGWVNIPVMLRAVRHWLAQSASIVEEHFDYDSLTLNSDLAIYKDFEAEYVIFCTGIRNKENPLFSNLPILPNKGQVLTVRLPNYSDGPIVNFGSFLIPIGNELFRLGATYELDPKDDRPSTEALHELLIGLKGVYKGPVELIEHHAAYRPTTITRKPLIGKHPQLTRAICFNGLGSKGVLLAPWMAGHLYKHLAASEKILPDVKLDRYFL